MGQALRYDRSVPSNPKRTNRKPAQISPERPFETRDEGLMDWDCEGRPMHNRYLFTTFLALLSVVSVSADVRYTTKMKTVGAPTEVTTTTWVKGKRQRMEMLTDMGSYKSKTVTLTLCDTKQTAMLDPDLKIYSVTPMFTVDGKPEAGAGTGTVTNTYTVKDLGMDTIAKLKAHHWMVTTRSVGTGCIGTFDTTSKVEIWTAPIEVLNCWDQNAYSQPNCRVKYTENGDVKGMRAAYNGMAVKMITYQGEAKTSEQEFVDYSTETLDAGLFGFPKDYKQVSAAEYQQQQQQKMMKQYQMPKP